MAVSGNEMRVVACDTSMVRFIILAAIGLGLANAATADIQDFGFARAKMSDEKSAIALSSIHLQKLQCQQQQQQRDLYARLIVMHLDRVAIMNAIIMIIYMME